MDNQPIVSVNILSYNRKNELRNTITHVLEQDYKNIEVIVVDNASTDGSPDMIKSEFPQVLLIELPKNIGIAGWNEGFKAARGEYVLVLDDDSYPDKQAISEGIKYFINSDKIGIIAFNIFNNRIKKSETAGFDNTPKFFVGCGAIIKKEVFNKIGLYNSLYFIYYHELDFSARCYDAGYEIKYLSNTYIFHNQNLLSRGKKKEDPYFSEYRFTNYFISYSIFLIQNFDARFSARYLFKWFLNRSLICGRYFFIKGYFQAILHLLKIWPEIIRNRKPLNINTQMFYEFGNVPLVEKSVTSNV